MHAADIKLTHVPYRGAAPAITDLLAGQIDGVVDNPPTVLPYVEAGRLRALAVAAKNRMALLPDLPTAAQAGVPNFEASSCSVCGTSRHAAGDRRKTAHAIVARSTSRRCASASPKPARGSSAIVRRNSPSRSFKTAKCGAKSSNRPVSRRSKWAGYSPGAAAWMASAWTPPASSSAKIPLIRRCRSTRVLPLKAPDTI